MNTPVHHRNSKLLLIGLILIAHSVLTGCANETLPVPQAPVIETIAENDGTETIITDAPDNEEIKTPDDTVKLAIKTDMASVTFPDGVQFQVKGESDSAIESISLAYGTDKHTIAEQTNSTDLDFAGGNTFDVSWDWTMKKLGSIPTGATIWWYWNFTDIEGNSAVTEKRTVLFDDSRFLWKNTQLENLEIFWNGQDESLRQVLLNDLETKLARIQLDVTIPESRKIKVYVYRSSDELRGAVLHEQQWTGALAFPDYNIILTAISQNNIDWAIKALPHEITHLLVGEFIFGPYSDIPTWLNEGLSIYSEGILDTTYIQLIKDAYSEDNLLSIKSLSGDFSSDRQKAYLSYGESGSVVAYLIDNYGWSMMTDLLVQLKNGVSYDDALTAIYGFNTEGLQAEWVENIVAEY